MELVLLWWKCIAYDFTDNGGTNDLGCRKWIWIEDK